MHNSDTIAAIATPSGIGGIGIIRLSGPEAYNIALTITNKKQLKPRYATYANFANIDNGIALYFPGPNSYTGEDTIELQGHGSTYSLKELLKLCLNHGAKLATPGEFTKRAFINGKLKLSEAESVIDLIHATTEKSHAVSLNHLQGKLSDTITAYRTTLMLYAEQIEASIDFPDEVDPIDRTTFKKDLSNIQENLQHMIELKDFGAHITAGIKCVIVGRPNVGKSSLFNALLGQNRAIVTDIEGTTRDFIEASIELGGLQFKLYDTAGVRESDDYIEHLGIEKIQNLIQDADAIIWVLDNTEKLTENDQKVYEKIKEKSPIYILTNKSDLPTKLETSTLPHSPIQISTTTKEGLEEFKQHLYKDFVESIEHVDLDLICNIRQIQCLTETQTHISQLLTIIHDNIADDLMSVDLKKAIEKLGEITGDNLTEELLDNIFSRFCIGK